jgi:hypothetical protein
MTSSQHQRPKVQGEETQRCASLPQGGGGTALTLNNDAKIVGPGAISVETDALAKAVAREQVTMLRHIEPWNQADEALRKAYIPAAA